METTVREVVLLLPVHFKVLQMLQGPSSWTSATNLHLLPLQYHQETALCRDPNTLRGKEIGFATELDR